MPLRLPASITVVDVGPRDGLQSFPRAIDTDTKVKMIDRLSVYAELGIDEVLTASNFGQHEDMTLDMMSRFAEDVMPHFRELSNAA